MSFFTGFVTGLANSVSDQIDQKEEDKRTRAQMRLKYMLENDSKLQEREAESAKLMKTANSIAKEYGDPRLAAVVYEKLDAGYDIKSAKDFLDSNKITFNDSKPNPVAKVDEQMEASGLAGNKPKAQPAPTMPMNPDMDPAVQPVPPSSAPSKPAEAQPAPEQKKPGLFSGIFGGGKSDEDMAAEDFRTITGRDYAQAPKTGGMDGVEYSVERRAPEADIYASEHKLKVWAIKEEESGDPERAANAKRILDRYYGIKSKNMDPSGEIGSAALGRMNVRTAEVHKKVASLKNAKTVTDRMMVLAERSPAILTSAGSVASGLARLGNEANAYMELAKQYGGNILDIPRGVIESELQKDVAAIENQYGKQVAEDYKQLQLDRYTLAHNIATLSGNVGAGQSNEDFARALEQTGTASSPPALAKQLNFLLSDRITDINNDIDMLSNMPDYRFLMKQYEEAYGSKEKAAEALDYLLAIRELRDTVGKPPVTQEEEPVQEGTEPVPAERQPASTKPAPEPQQEAPTGAITLDVRNPRHKALVEKYPALRPYIGKPLTNEQMKAIVGK